MTDEQDKILFSAIAGSKAMFSSDLQSVVNNFPFVHEVLFTADDGEINRQERCFDQSFTEKLLEMDDLEFFKHIRISKQAFYELENILRCSPTYDYPNKLGPMHQMKFSEALLMVLWYLASKTTFRETALQFGCSSGQANKLFYKIVNIINTTQALKISWPLNLEEKRRGFEAIGNFPGTVGAIDGTHIKVRVPETVQKDYNSRKFVHTVLLLAVCDAEKRFTMVATGIPGSVHDQRALDMTNFGQNIKNYPNDFFPSKNLHIIGDSAFSLRLNVMTPFRDNGRLTQREVNFNTKLSQSRQVIENAFGYLKNRFRVLQYLEVNIEHAAPIIHACCILHNFALSHCPSVSDEEPRDELVIEGETERQKRNFIADSL